MFIIKYLIRFVFITFFYEFFDSLQNSVRKIRFKKIVLKICGSKIERGTCWEVGVGGENGIARICFVSLFLFYKISVKKKSE